MTDRAILASLQADARLSNKELAARVDLAPSSCLERVRRLRDAGVIRGFRTEVDPGALGIGLQAMVSVRLRLHSRQNFESFRAHMLQLPEVVSLYQLAGAEDFLVHVAVRDSEHLRDLTLDGFTSREEVAHIETFLLFDHVRSETLPDYGSAAERAR